MNARDHARKTMCKRKHSFAGAVKPAPEPVKVTEAKIDEAKAETTEASVTVKKGKKKVSDVSVD